MAHVVNGILYKRLRALNDGKPLAKAASEPRIRCVGTPHFVDNTDGRTACCNDELLQPSAKAQLGRHTYWLTHFARQLFGPGL